MSGKQTVALALAVVVTAAGGALAAPAAVKDPTTLVLRKADVPGAKGGPTLAGMRDLEQWLRQLGVRVRGASYTYEFVTGPARGWTVSGLVLAAASAPQAAKVFTAFRKPMTTEGTALRLRLFGAQQHAILVRNAVGADLLVRKNTVVWMLSVRTEGVEGMTRTRIVAELTKYARRQQARVGKG